MGSKMGSLFWETTSDLGLPNDAQAVLQRVASELLELLLEINKLRSTRWPGAWV